MAKTAKKPTASKPAKKTGIYSKTNFRPSPNVGGVIERKERSSKQKTEKSMPKKVATEKKERSPRLSLKLIGDNKITILSKTNPKREGSAAHKKFEWYKDGQTVTEFLEAGGSFADLRYDLTKGYIAVEGVIAPEADEPAEVSDDAETSTDDVVEEE